MDKYTVAKIGCYTTQFSVTAAVSNALLSLAVDRSNPAIAGINFVGAAAVSMIVGNEAGKYVEQKIIDHL